MSSTVLAVSGLPADLSEEALQDYFSRVGPVASVELQGEGHARVTMEKEEDVESALQLNGAEYREGVHLQVQPAATAAPAEGEGEREEKSGERKPRYEEGKAIVVRNVPASLRDAEKARELFAPCGEITDLFVDPRGGRFIFVSFATTEAADKAVEKNGTEVDGSALEVVLRHPQPPKREHVRLVVKNLPVAATETQVRELFSTAGTLTDCFLKADRQLCYISYATAEEADNAMALQGRELAGSRVEVERRERQKCYLCGKEGHLSAQCRSMVCHNCGKAGHKARECRQPPSGRRGPPPPPRRDVDRRGDFRDGGRRDRDDFRDRRRRRSDSYDRPARRRSRSPPSYRRRSRSPPNRSPPRQRRRHSRSRSPPRRRY